MSGDIEHAKRVLRRECYPPNEGLCVTIEPVTYFYAGVEESGFVVELANYPRFPKSPEDILNRAVSITDILISELCQRSALLIVPRTPRPDGSTGGTYFILAECEVAIDDFDKPELPDVLKGKDLAWQLPGGTGLSSKRLADYGAARRVYEEVGFTSPWKEPPR